MTRMTEKEYWEAKKMLPQVEKTLNEMCIMLNSERTGKTRVLSSAQLKKLYKDSKRLMKLVDQMKHDLFMNRPSFEL